MLRGVNSAFERHGAHRRPRTSRSGQASATTDGLAARAAPRRPRRWAGRRWPSPRRGPRAAPAAARPAPARPPRAAGRSPWRRAGRGARTRRRGAGCGATAASAALTWAALAVAWAPDGLDGQPRRRWACSALARAWASAAAACAARAGRRRPGPGRGLETDTSWGRDSSRFACALRPRPAGRRAPAAWAFGGVLRARPRPPGCGGEASTRGGRRAACACAAASRASASASAASWSEQSSSTQHLAGLHRPSLHRPQRRDPGGRPARRGPRWSPRSRPTLPAGRSAPAAWTQRRTASRATSTTTTTATTTAMRRMRRAPRPRGTAGPRAPGCEERAVRSRSPRAREFAAERRAGGASRRPCKDFRRVVRPDAGTARPGGPPAPNRAPPARPGGGGPASSLLPPRCGPRSPGRSPWRTLALLALRRRRAAAPAPSPPPAAAVAAPASPRDLTLDEALAELDRQNLTLDQARSRAGGGARGGAAGRGAAPPHAHRRGRLLPQQRRGRGGHRRPPLAAASRHPPRQPPSSDPHPAARRLSARHGLRPRPARRPRRPGSTSRRRADAARAADASASATRLAVAGRPVQSRLARRLGRRGDRRRLGAGGGDLARAGRSARRAVAGRHRGAARGPAGRDRGHPAGERPRPRPLRARPRPPRRGRAPGHGRAGAHPAPAVAPAGGRRRRRRSSARRSTPRPELRADGARGPLLREQALASARWRLAPQLSPPARPSRRRRPLPHRRRSTGGASRWTSTWTLYDGGYRYGRASAGLGRPGRREAGARRPQQLQVLQEVQNAARDVEVARRAARGSRGAPAGDRRRGRRLGEARLRGAASPPASTCSTPTTALTVGRRRSPPPGRGWAPPRWPSTGRWGGSREAAGVRGATDPAYPAASRRAADGRATSPHGFAEIQRQELIRPLRPRGRDPARLRARRDGARGRARLARPGPWRRGLLGALIAGLIAFFVVECRAGRQPGHRAALHPAEPGRRRASGTALIALGTGGLREPGPLRCSRSLAITSASSSPRRASSRLVGFQVAGGPGFALLELLGRRARPPPARLRRRRRACRHPAWTGALLVTFLLVGRRRPGAGHPQDLRRHGAARPHRPGGVAPAPTGEREAELSALSAEIAHELKNPLASVKGLAGAARRRPSTDAQLGRAARGAAPRGGPAAGHPRRVPQLLPAARAARARAAPTWARSSREVAVLHEGMARERGVAAGGPTAAARARCDPRKVKQVLINLVQNALDASPAGAAVDIEVQDGAGGRRGSCASSTGAGASTRPLGEPGLRARASPPRRAGSGLGLTVARAIARQHGGDLRLAPREGGGLPGRAHACPPAPPAEVAAVPSERPAAEGRPRVLVVDDDAGVRYTLREILESEGLEVDEAADGDARRWSGSRRSAPTSSSPTCACRAWTGWSCSGGSARAPPAPRVVLITAHGSERQAVEAMKAGAYDYFRKPFETDELAGGGAARRRGGAAARRERAAGRASWPSRAPWSSTRRPCAGWPRWWPGWRPRDVTVLLTGESGTGKERVAEALVRASPRADKPVRPLQLRRARRPSWPRPSSSATPAAPSPARCGPRPGLFGEADGGTILLDEVGELAAAAAGQAAARRCRRARCGRWARSGRARWTCA